MRTTSRSTPLLVGLSLFSLGAHAMWPIKTIDLSEDGALCDPATEQYLQVEGYDFHDHPKFTMRWTQITGACGAPVDDPMMWEVSYDGSTDDAEDESPLPTNAGRVQLNLFVCCPFGDYEIDMDVESFSDEGSTREQRTAWEIENGPDEFHIWDTVNTDFKDIEEYSPTVNGQYTWPLEGETGYYKTLYAGPLPPLECSSSAPSRTAVVGCFADSSSNRLLDSGALVLGEMGRDGMSPQVCSDRCSGFEYFGVEFGRECFCGTAEEFASAVPSDQCGLTHQNLCTGDATVACGGNNAIRVYQRTDDTPAPTVPSTDGGPTFPPLTPAPTPSATEFALAGCFPDSKSNRVMEFQVSDDEMSAEICFDLCNDGTNTHFGTQFARECWCGVDADLTKNGDMLAIEACDFLCAGTTSGEFCGGRNKLTAYEIAKEVAPTPAPTDAVPTGPEYIGCYEDGRVRAMNAEGKYTNGAMTNEACVAFCGENGHAFAGTQFSLECWCGDSFDLYGPFPENLCSFPCQGDVGQECGGRFALSVYSTA